MRCASECRVVVESMEAVEDQEPIVLAAAQQRQFLRARVADVNGNVPEVLAQPPERHRRAVAVAGFPERHDEQRRDE
jgi:hypothetical protein